MFRFGKFVWCKSSDYRNCFITSVMEHYISVDGYVQILLPDVFAENIVEAFLCNIAVIPTSDTFALWYHSLCGYIVTRESLCVHNPIGNNMTSTVFVS